MEMDRRTRRSNIKEGKWIEGQENLIPKKEKWLKIQENVIPKIEGYKKILIKQQFFNADSRNSGE